MSDLAELGLSNYEARVYRALLGLGPATASEISETSGVPSGRIYDVLNGLEGRGLVRIRESREPTRYVAIDPEAAVDRLLAERKRELADQRRRYEEIAATVSTELAPTVPAESRFWTAPLGSEAALSLVDEQFDIAEETITSVIGVPYENATWGDYEAEIEAIEGVFDPELDVRVLVSADLAERIPATARERLVDMAEGVEMRVTATLSVTVDVLDGETIYVHVPDPFDGSERLGVVAVRDERFAEQLETAFQDVWERAAPVSTSGRPQ